jgi:hypothetical protein
VMLHWIVSRRRRNSTDDRNQNQQAREDLHVGHLFTSRSSTLFEFEDFHQQSLSISG